MREQSPHETFTDYYQTIRRDIRENSNFTSATRKLQIRTTFVGTVGSSACNSLLFQGISHHSTHETLLWPNTFGKLDYYVVVEYTREHQRSVWRGGTDSSILNL